MSAEVSSSVPKGPRRRPARIVRTDKPYVGVRYEAKSGVTQPELSEKDAETINQRILAHRARVTAEMAKLSKGMNKRQRLDYGYEMGNAVKLCQACQAETVEPRRCRWHKVAGDWLCEGCYNLLYETFVFLSAILA